MLVDNAAFLVCSIALYLMYLHIVLLLSLKYIVNSI